MISEIKAIRESIRYHRAQISDYRCWVDDLRLYQAAGISGYQALSVPQPAEFMSRCESFWDKRQRAHEQGLGDPTVNSSVAVLPIESKGDHDLDSMPEFALRQELAKLRQGVALHEALGFSGRTVKDDIDLYALLPDAAEWNSALPAREYFLSNCSRFCAHCQGHPESLLEWSIDK